MLLKITLTCFLCFIFAATASLPYREKRTEYTPSVIVYSVAITMGLTLLFVFITLLDTIWGFTQ